MRDSVLEKLQPRVITNKKETASCKGRSLYQCVPVILEDQRKNSQGEQNDQHKDQ